MTGFWLPPPHATRRNPPLGFSAFCVPDSMPGEGITRSCRNLKKSRKLLFPDMFGPTKTLLRPNSRVTSFKDLKFLMCTLLSIEIKFIQNGGQMPAVFFVSPSAVVKTSQQRDNQAVKIQGRITAFLLIAVLVVRVL